MTLDYYDKAKLMHGSDAVYLKVLKLVHVLHVLSTFV